jgi:hypothetical protein
MRAAVAMELSGLYRVSEHLTITSIPSRIILLVPTMGQTFIG